MDCSMIFFHLDYVCGQFGRGNFLVLVLVFILYIKFQLFSFILAGQYPFEDIYYGIVNQPIPEKDDGIFNGQNIDSEILSQFLRDVLFCKTT